MIRAKTARKALKTCPEGAASPSSVSPTITRRLPADFRSIEMHRRTLGTIPKALMSKVPGMARLRFSCVYSL